MLSPKASLCRGTVETDRMGEEWELEFSCREKMSLFEFLLYLFTFL